MRSYRPPCPPRRGFAPLDRVRSRKFRASRILTTTHRPGSCNGCELEIHALSNPYYDLERFGLKFVASPRHADVLLVTGPVTHNMAEALQRAWRATPDPKWVVAAGDCACTGGVFAGSYACIGPVANAIPVDLHIKGCPPTPTALLEGLLALLEKAAKG